MTKVYEVSYIEILDRAITLWLHTDQATTLQSCVDTAMEALSYIRDYGCDPPHKEPQEFRCGQFVRAKIQNAATDGRHVVLSGTCGLVVECGYGRTHMSILPCGQEPLITPKTIVGKLLVVRTEHYEVVKQ